MLYVYGPYILYTDHYNGFMGMVAHKYVELRISMTIMDLLHYIGYYISKMRGQTDFSLLWIPG